MIVLSDVNHIAIRGRKHIPIFEGTDFVFGNGHVGLVVENARTAEIVFDLLVGYFRPKSGIIRRFGRVSWPIGRVLQFRSELSGRKTLRFLCRLYDLDYDSCAEKAHDMMDIDRHFDRGIIHWPRELMLEFGYFASLLPDFDTYLVEGTASTGNEVFNAAWHAEFKRKIRGRNLIYQSNSERYLADYVSSAVALVDGKFRYFSVLGEAFTGAHSLPVVEDPVDRINDVPLLDDQLI